MLFDDLYKLAFVDRIEWCARLRLSHTNDLVQSTKRTLHILSQRWELLAASRLEITPERLFNEAALAALCGVKSTRGIFRTDHVAPAES